MNGKLLHLAKQRDSNKERAVELTSELEKLKKATEEIENQVRESCDEYYHAYKQMKLSMDKRGAIEVKKQLRETKNLQEAEAYELKKQLSKYQITKYDTHSSRSLILGIS